MIDETVNKHISETSLSRTREHTIDHDTGMITAFRYATECGTGEVYTKSQNQQRNKSLLSKLQSMRYGVTKVKGSYIENYGSKNAREVAEDTFFVVDLQDKGRLEKDLRSLGEEFEQDSILFLPKGGQTGMLIGTNQCPDTYPGYKKVVKMKNPVFGQKGEFMTRVNGRPFILKEDLEILQRPEGYFGRMGCSMVSKKHWSEVQIDE